MRLCPYCHTQLIEDAPFCPECRHSLAVTGQAVPITGQAVEGKSKKKLAVIIACVIASIVIVVLVTNPLTSMAEPPIPAYFTTYIDELGLFSISYPPEFELYPVLIDEQATQNIISSINSGLPITEAYIVFAAGLTMQCNFMVAVGSLCAKISTHDQMVAAEIGWKKDLAPDYQELSRVKTTVDGRPATLVEYNMTLPGSGTRLHCVSMLCMVNRTSWEILCSTSPAEYSNWEDVFDAIVRSLRILK